MSRRYAQRLPHTVAGTMVMGLNYPCDTFEVFPGESFKITASNLTRFMPQISPTMGDVTLGVDVYQVPWRQLFDKLGLDWDAYLTGGEAGTDNQVLPTITIPEGGIESGGLADWLNYPTNYTDPQTGDKVIVGAGLVLNALPIVCYMHIINENSRDQNFIAKLDLTKYEEFFFGTYAFETPQGDPIEYDLLVNGLFRKAWSRDYYGRSMSNTQRGPAVRVPMAGSAPIKFDVNNGTAIFGYGTRADNRPVKLKIGDSNGDYSIQAESTSAGSSLGEGNGGYRDTTAYADLTGVTAVDLLTFRLAARMQRFGEVLQTAGARAVEFTYRMFGVRIPDARIQRPIFHGSFRIPIIFSEVLQTSATESTSPQGNLAGHGIGGGTNAPIHIKCIEHGYVMMIAHVMPKAIYQNVIPKYLLRSTRWDIPNPLFSHIGDQATLRKEIYPNSENPDEVFGYVPRYTELSFLPSTIHGQFKGPMLHWTMARVFENEPVLGAAFRYGNPSNRSFAVQYLDDEKTIPADEMQVQIGFDIQARRVFPRNAQPGIHIV